MEVQASNKAFLNFYKYSPISLTFDLATNISLGSVSGQPWQTMTTLIRTTTGVIYKLPGATTFTFVETKTYSWATSSPTFNTNGKTVGTVSLGNLVLVQTRDNPITYSSSETNPPTIVGFMNNDYVYQVTWTSNELLVSNSIAMPCLPAVAAVTAITWCTEMFITLAPQLFDVGVN
jgi:hypothetical protein